MDEKETSFYATVLIVCGVLGIIIFYFILSIIRQQRRALKLHKQSIYTEITTLEKERTRMAADLHDEVGPVLSAVKLKLNSLDLHDPEDREEVDRTNQQIDNLLRRMREISFDLMPQTLTRKGLIAAVNEFIEYCSRSSDLRIDLEHEPVPLTQLQSINLYRIIQEIVHNTIKHSGASALKISLRKDKNMVILTTQDNGTGFSYDINLQDSKGQGLRNLLNRSEIIGGKMYFESNKAKGTSYSFEIPIKDETDNTHQDHSG